MFFYFSRGWRRNLFRSHLWFNSTADCGFIIEKVRIVLKVKYFSPFTKVIVLIRLNIQSSLLFLNWRYILHSYFSSSKKNVKTIIVHLAFPDTVFDIEKENLNSNLSAGRA